MGFRRRLALFIVVTLIVVQVITAIIAMGVLRHNAIEEGKRRLTTATVVFMRQLDLLSDRVGDEVNVLALDYGLRQAIASGDRNTVLSVLRNHGRRVGASRMLLVDLNGNIAADTAHSNDSGQPFPFSDIISGATNDNQATALAAFDGGIYWIVAAPVKTPLPIAFVAACVPIDDALLSRLRDLSAIPNSIALATPTAQGDWRVIASTNSFHPNIHARVITDANASNAEVVQQQGSSVLTWTAQLKSASQSPPVIAVLDYPLSAALESNRDIVVSMLFVLAGALIVGLIGAMLTARGVAKPVEELAVAARRIAAGDYSLDMPNAGNGEIGQLSVALSQMATAIAEREAVLKRTVEELAAARDEAVRANEAKSQFLANMSHELRTPLNAILGFSEIMTEQVLGPIGNDRYVVYAQDINASGRHLLSLVEEMLDLSRVEAGTMAISREGIDIADVVANAVKMLAPVAEKASVTMLVAGDPSNWPVINGDAGKLRQAISNIIHNGIKFTPAGGHVVISAEAASEMLRIKIADTGIGMRENDIPIVVKPFQRLSSAFDGKYQGVGLGLPFAKAVAELHGGKLSIASTVGIGTTVLIDLPLARAGAQPFVSAA